MPVVGGQFGPWIVAIPASSRHKEAAFLLAQWIDSREIMIATEIANPPRLSMLTDPVLQKKYPFYGPSLLVYEKGFILPLFPEFVEWADKVQSTLSRSLVGEITPEEALRIAQSETVSLMKRSGYKW